MRCDDGTGAPFSQHVTCIWVLEHSSSCYVLTLTREQYDCVLCIIVYAALVDVLTHAVDLHKTASR